jgi:ATP-dependent Clp protease protease subunit
MEKKAIISQVLESDDDDDDDIDDEKPENWQDLLAGKMLKTRTILLSGEIRKGLAEKTIRQLL